MKSAPVRLHRKFRMNRQATVSLEGRGCVAYWDARQDELLVYLSTQGGHVMRLGLARALGLPENQIRVIAPDVGGGFGGKNRLLPEEIAVCAIALEAQSSGALDRGPARASARLRALPRSSLRSRHQRREKTAPSSASKATSISMPAPMRCGRPAPSWKPAWRRQSARALSRARAQREHMDGRDQQGADGTLSRRRAARRMFRDRAAGR